MEWLYVGGHGTLDLVAETYTCLIKKRGGPLLIYSKGSQTADIIFRPDAGFSDKCGQFVPEAGTDTFFGNGSSFDFAYRCDDVRIVVSFSEDRIEVKCDYSGEEIIPDVFRIGRGSMLFTDRIFTPSQPDFNLPIAHYLHPEEAVDLSPGLMTPAPWCFSARQDDGCWMGFSLEPDKQLDFAGFGSEPGVGHEIAFRVIYDGCRPACRTLDIPPLVMRFGMKDEFEVFSRHTDHLLECGKVDKPSAFFGWHRGVSACGWRWQQGTKPTQELYEKNVAMFENLGIDFDMLIIDDFWGESKEHGVWKACERWHDLRGFIEKRHAEGRKVLLWVCTYSDGLPDDEKAGQFHDIDSEKWRARLCEDAHRMLSSDEGCYNADGIKFDFTALYPKTPECSHYGVGYILERYKLVAEAMRAVKPDAMLLNQSMNPYFIKYQSAIRLNDFTALPCHGLEEMRIRGKIARAVGMGLPVDSDHVACSAKGYEGGLDFFRHMESVGGISIYVNEKDIEMPGLLDMVKELSARHCLREKQK